MSETKTAVFTDIAAVLATAGMNSGMRVVLLTALPVDSNWTAH